MRGKIPSLILNHVSDIQVLHRQYIIVLPEKSFADEVQAKCLIIVAVIVFGLEIFVAIARHALFEETKQAR